MARNAQALFERNPPMEKRRLLNFVVSNSTRRDGELRTTFRQPFDLLAESSAIIAQANRAESGNLPARSGWLGN
jgi:site-specific DNA recombinase